MLVYVVTWEVGLVSGETRLVGIYSSPEKARVESEKYYNNKGFGTVNITHLNVNETLDITIREW